MTYKSAVAQHLVRNPKTWVDANTINSIGGADGTRRLRELRAEGWSIKSRRNPQMPTTFEYQLSRVPAKKTVAQYV